MALVAAKVEGVVEVAQDFGGLDIDGVLFLEFVLLVAWNECELVDLFAQICPDAGKRAQILVDNPTRLYWAE